MSRQTSSPRRRPAFILLTLLAFISACSSSPGGDQASSDASKLPELTDELIRTRINDTRVWDVPPESGTGDTIVWNFDNDEPKEITIVDKQVDGAHATIVLDIKTNSSPRSRKPRLLAGQIKTEWQLKTGWALRRWEIVATENISMKYRDVAKPEQTPPGSPAPGM